MACRRCGRYPRELRLAPLEHKLSVLGDSLLMFGDLSEMLLLPKLALRLDRRNFLIWVRRSDNSQVSRYRGC
jgi:hypothetical protein